MVGVVVGDSKAFFYSKPRNTAAIEESSATGFGGCLRSGVGEGRAAGGCQDWTGHVRQYGLDVENVEDVGEGCAVGAFEAGCCQSWVGA